MKSFVYRIKDSVGIHARPANKLVQFLSSYKSKVTIKFGDKQANAKSIINLMALGLSYDSEIEFLIDGEDEDRVFSDLPIMLDKEKI